jgi:hypothetical protein
MTVKIIAFYVKRGIILPLLKIVLDFLTKIWYNIFRRERVKG